MNSRNAFGYIGTPDTCLWCGCKLKPTNVGDTEGRTGLGRYGLGFFHADSCAVQFAHKFAQLGERLKVGPARELPNP